MPAGDSTTAADQLTDLVAWLQQPEASKRAHDELRHLGLPSVLADDLLAAASHTLLLEADRRGRPFTTADPHTPACRALTTAARSLLRARRTAPAVAPTPVTEPEGGPADVEVGPLEANRVVADHRRRAIAALAGHRPHDLAAALTALTLATEPAIQPEVDPPTTPPSDDVDRQAWIGLWYADRAGTDLPSPTARRATHLAHADRQQAAIARIRRLLAAALAVDSGATAPGLVDRGDPSEPAAGAARPPEQVHRRAAHG